MTTDDDLLNDLLNDPFGEEALLPRLQPYVREWTGLGLVFHHRLFISVPYDEAENKRINRILPWREQKAEELKRGCQWAKFLFLHERPYRLNAFLEIESLLTDAEYWSEVSWLWTDSNNIFEHRKEWRRIWMTKRPGRLNVMGAEERKVFDELPDPITIYRGTYMIPEGCRGMSWTVDLNIAKRFATKHVPPEGEPHIIRATLRKRNVLAYFSRENEIVTLPERVRDSDLERLQR